MSHSQHHTVELGRDSQHESEKLAKSQSSYLISNHSTVATKQKFKPPEAARK